MTLVEKKTIFSHEWLVFWADGMTEHQGQEVPAALDGFIAGLLEARARVVRENGDG